MSRVCYTQDGSCEVQIFTLAGGEFVCLCAFPRPASRISSRCQLHFPVANCILLAPFSPPCCIFLVPPTTTIPLAPKPFLLSEQHRPLSFGKERTRRFFEPVYTVQLGGGGGGEAAVLSENQSPFAELQCTLLFLFIPNLNWNNFGVSGRDKLFWFQFEQEQNTKSNQRHEF